MRVGCGGGGGNYVGAFVCGWGAKYRQAFFNARLVDMVAIEWNVGLFAIWKVARCANCGMDEYFLNLFGIITISTTRVDFVCLG